jgi:deoxyribonuclease V
MATFIWMMKGKRGLGAYLYDALQQQIPIIGVAKTNFHTINEQKLELVRGKSTRPLYVTAAGIPLSHAAEHIKSMAGDHRMPMLLKELDVLTRN